MNKSTITSMLLFASVMFAGVMAAEAYEDQEFGDGKSTVKMPLTVTEDSFDIIQVRPGLNCVWDGVGNQTYLDCDWVGYHRWVDAESKKEKILGKPTINEEGIQKLEYPYN